MAKKSTYGWKKKSGPGFIRRNLLKLAFLASAAGVGGYRFGTEKTVEAEVVAVKTGSDGAHRVILKNGKSFYNVNSPLAFKFGHAADDLQSAFKAGNVYKFTVYGFEQTGQNIVRVEVVKGDIPVTPGIQEPPASSVAPPEKPPVFTYFKQTQAPAVAETGPRRFNEGSGNGFALTEKEKAFVTALFGPGMHLDDPRLFFYRNEDPSTAAQVQTAWAVDASGTPTALTVQFAQFMGMRFVSKEFTEEGPEALSTFAHEMTHIWQGQTLWSHTSKDNEGVYKHTLHAGARFSDYGNEQQASIIGNYVTRFISATKGETEKCSNTSRGDTPETDALLRDIVERHFPWAKAFRLKLEAERGAIPPASAKAPAP